MLLRELVEDCNAYYRKHGQDDMVVLMESVLPKSDGKTCDDAPGCDDVHARLIAAMNGELLLGATPLPKAKDLEEQKEIELPDGIHFKLLGIK